MKTKKQNVQSKNEVIDIKEPKEQTQTKRRCCTRPAFWKVIAIVAIVLFAVFVVSGLMKAHRFKNSFIKPTDKQLELAKDVAIKSLESTGANASEFKISFGKVMPRRLEEKSEQSKIIIPVSFSNNQTTHVYLVDADSGELLMHSQTDIYKQIGNQPKNGARELKSPFAGFNVEKSSDCINKEKRCDHR